MKWTRHQPHARMKKPPSVTVNYHGNILFNVKALRQLIKKSRYAEIFFDSNQEGSTQYIGVRFFTEPTSFSKLLKIKKCQAILDINRKIAAELGIEKHTAKRFPLEFDAESEVWYINKDNGVLFKTDHYKH